MTKSKERVFAETFGLSLGVASGTGMFGGVLMAHNSWLLFVVGFLVVIGGATIALYLHPSDKQLRAIYGVKE